MHVIISLNGPLDTVSVRREISYHLRHNVLKHGDTFEYQHSDEMKVTCDEESMTEYLFDEVIGAIIHAIL